MSKIINLYACNSVEAWKHWRNELHASGEFFFSELSYYEHKSDPRVLLANERVRRVIESHESVCNLITSDSEVINNFLNLEADDEWTPKRIHVLVHILDPEGETRVYHLCPDKGYLVNTDPDGADWPFGYFNNHLTWNDFQ